MKNRLKLGVKEMLLVSERKSEYIESVIYMNYSLSMCLCIHWLFSSHLYTHFFFIYIYIYIYIYIAQCYYGKTSLKPTIFSSDGKRRKKRLINHICFQEFVLWQDVCWCGIYTRKYINVVQIKKNELWNKSDGKWHRRNLLMTLLRIYIYIYIYIYI